MEDLRIAAKILRGKKIHPNVRMIIIPGSREVQMKALHEGLIDIFLSAYAVVSTPSCGGCAGMQAYLSDKEVCISQGFLGLKGLGVGLLTESIPRGSFRVAINAGVYVLPNCPGVTKFVENGDILEVDFAGGKIKNLSQKNKMEVDSIPEILLEILSQGGGLGYLKNVVSAESL